MKLESRETELPVIGIFCQKLSVSVLPHKSGTVFPSR